MAPLRSGSARVQAGVSLIEILVGLGIGLVAVLAIFQTVAIWSRHTQTTSAGGDAQIAGTLALFGLGAAGLAGLRRRRVPLHDARS